MFAHKTSDGTNEWPHKEIHYVCRWSLSINYEVQRVRKRNERELSDLHASNHNLMFNLCVCFFSAPIPFSHHNFHRFTIPSFFLLRALRVCNVQLAANCDAHNLHYICLCSPFAITAPLQFRRFYRRTISFSPHIPCTATILSGYKNRNTSAPSIFVQST